MVCERCQAKLNRVICPDVAKKPLYKADASGSGAGSRPAAEEAKEERKMPVPLYKRK